MFHILGEGGVEVFHILREGGVEVGMECVESGWVRS